MGFGINLFSDMLVWDCYFLWLNWCVDVGDVCDVVWY